ncbi:uncharacterized protein PRCAT00005732001 [Priceomyces carsonii]|uniref:uncharacterized protein n=1 Tax=Priceomyces carsonii TaxID=28549 RepID=UPI002ED7DC69|nr:unnamed protein product [Priceomyces carsonii]
MSIGPNSPQEQNAFSNLDQDLKRSRLLKYRNSEDEVKSYIQNILNVPEKVILEYEKRDMDLVDMLKDGELLCNLGSLTQIPENPCTKYKNSKMSFVQMENISFFLSLCHLIGVAQDEIFQTVDLFERKDPYQVVVTIIAFSRVAHKINPLKFPIIIGPRVSKVKPSIPKKPINLRS